MKTDILTLTFSPLQRDEMLCHVKGAFPEEACGFLAGIGGVVSEVIPVTNRLHSQVEFLMEAQEQIDALLGIEKKELELLAVFHSHPNGPIVPSEMDLKRHYSPYAAILLWSIVENKWMEHAYLSNVNGFQEIPIQILDR